MDKNFLNVPVIGRIYKPLFKVHNRVYKTPPFLYPKPTQSTLHLYNLNYFRNISFNIVRPFMLRANQLVSSLRLHSCLSRPLLSLLKCYKEFRLSYPFNHSIITIKIDHWYNSKIVLLSTADHNFSQSVKYSQSRHLV